VQSCLILLHYFICWGWGYWIAQVIMHIVKVLVNYIGKYYFNVLTVLNSASSNAVSMLCPELSWAVLHNFVSCNTQEKETLPLG
jgi:hypothetical protein